LVVTPLVLSAVTDWQTSYQAQYGLILPFSTDHIAKTETATRGQVKLSKRNDLTF
jgi:hypothetical protein